MKKKDFIEKWLPRINAGYDAHSLYEDALTLVEVGVENKDEEWFFPGPINPGISKREWYAGKAMQGLLAAEGGTPESDSMPGTVAKAAFRFADAMLKAESEREDI